MQQNDGLQTLTISDPIQAATLPPEVLQGLPAVVLIRAVEQRLLQMFAAGKLYGTVHTCIGQEWVGVAIARALHPGDLLFSNHRCHGHFLARTGNVDGLIAEVMGKQSGVCGGRGGSQHLCDRKLGFFSNGVQGGIVPVSTGMALSLQLNRSDDIAVVFIGDGTLGEGAVYEALNIAAKWDLPLLVVLENNRYAQSTSQQQTLAGSITGRAAGFGIETFRADTWQPERLLSVAAECVDTVRRERRPVFLQVDTDRLMAHSKGDDDRDAGELAEAWGRDFLNEYLKENPEHARTLLANAEELVDIAVSKAEASPLARYEESDQELTKPAVCIWTTTDAVPSERVVTRIRSALSRNMKRDPRIVLLGEDIESPYGGAFKVTKGLSDEFPGRVRNMPISESAIVGLGCGLALNGFVPVCEIMFGDFLLLAADQIVNHAAKFHYMYNGQVQVPLIIRTPMGGRRGYGPTHSQSLEKHFLGIPHTRVLALNGRVDPASVYDEVFASIDRVTLIIENKVLYAAQLDMPVPDGFTLEHSSEQFPATRLRPVDAPEATVFCYGGMLLIVEQAIAAVFDEHEITAEVICPTQIYPLNPWPVIQSLRETRCLVIVEEGASFAAVGSELIAQIAELAPELLQRITRVGPPQIPIPSCGPLENELLPDPAKIVAALRQVTERSRA